MNEVSKHEKKILISAEKTKSSATSIKKNLVSSPNTRILKATNSHKSSYYQIGDTEIKKPLKKKTTLFDAIDEKAQKVQSSIDSRKEMLKNATSKKSRFVLKANKKETGSSSEDDAQL